MSFNLRLAQIINQTNPDANQNFYEGDIVQVLYELERKFFVKNLMIDGAIFDFVQANCVQFIQYPNHILETQHIKSDLYVAISDFFECESGDLSFYKNQIIIAHKSVDENWLFGSFFENGSKEGIFPITYVRKVNLSDSNLTNYINFDFEPRQAKLVRPVTSGLRVEVGDNFLIIGKLNEYFYYGENLDLEKGLVLRDTFVYTDQDKYDLFQPNCEVSHNFLAENINELDCCRGEKLQIMEDISHDWVRCKNSSGITGLVPRNFVTSESYFRGKINRPLYEKSQSLTNANVKSVELRSQSLTPNLMRTLSKKDTPPPRPPKPSKQFLEKMNIENKNLDNSTLSSLLFDFMSFGKMEQNEDLNEAIEETNEEKIKKRQNNLLNVLQELVETERNYFKELKLCYDCFMVEDLLSITDECPKEFDKRSLFDKIIPVINFSTKLLKSFETELEKNHNDFLKCKFSHNIHENLEQMKTIYAQYGRFYEQINSNLKNSEQNPQIMNYITGRLQTIKDSLSSVDISSIVIKPVQRVIKYLLFINRIIENMETSNEEYSSYIELRYRMSTALDYINEYKRAQDLVAKYLNRPNSTNDTNSSFSLSKKVQTFKKLKDRLSLQLYKSFGWDQYQVFDEQFDKVESNYRYIENILRNHLENLKAFSNIFGSILDCQKDIFNKMLYIFDDEFEKFHHFDISANHHRNKFMKEYNDFLTKKVIVPNNLLIKALTGPDKLIKKRYDKQLDYQNALYEYENKNLNEKEIENKINRTKKDYEALNMQLIDELPILSKLIYQVTLKTFKIFIEHTKKFIGRVHSTLNDDIISSRIDLTHDYNLCRIYMDSFFNRMMAVFNDENRKYEISQINSTISIQTQTEEQRNNVLNLYPKDKIYIIKQRYVANLNLCQLTQNINDIVGLVKPYNPAKDPNTWFVYNGKIEGFIPAVVLEPYEKYYNQKNLICFDEETQNDKKNCIAKFPLKAKASNMIDLIQGEHYTIIQGADQSGNSEWLLVQDKNGNIGYAPFNYLQILN